MTNILHIDGRAEDVKSLIALTGRDIELPSAEVPISFSATYQERQFVLSEIQDRTQDDNSGVLLFKFSPGGKSHTEDKLNGMYLYVVNKKDQRLEYMATGISRKPDLKQILQNRNPYIELGDDLEIRATDSAKSSFLYLFREIKPLIRNHIQRAQISDSLSRPSLN